MQYHTKRILDTVPMHVNCKFEKCLTFFAHWRIRKDLIQLRASGSKLHNILMENFSVSQKMKIYIIFFI